MGVNQIVAEIHFNFIVWRNLAISESSTVG